MSENNELTINGVIYVKKDSLKGDGFNIVVLDKGFVYVGRTAIVKADYGYEVHIANAKDLRVWGTTGKGLGFLANGPTDDTKFDPIDGIIVAPLHALIHMIPAREEKWQI
jgi:hypothetical protein